MDYEKKYNEALERAKKIHDEILNNELLGFPDQIREIFPELRESESEDERIRRELIDFIQWSEDRGMTRHDFHQAKRSSEWIAWLEKQKYDRMKPVYDNQDSFESALEKAWNDYHNGYENVDKLEDNYVECAHAKGFREGYLFGIEKQKEQKPVEWSEEDESCWNLIWDILDGPFTASKESFKKAAAWFLKNCPKGTKSLRPSWKPSEEQMNALNFTINYILSTNANPTVLRDLYNDLLKLK